MDGPFRLYNIEDEETGSADILGGFGVDDDFTALLRELGGEAGLPADGPPWVLADDRFGVEHFSGLHQLLRERMEGEGFRRLVDGRRGRDLEVRDGVTPRSKVGAFLIEQSLPP